MKPEWANVIVNGIYTAVSMSKILESFVITDYFRDEWKEILAGTKKPYFFVSVGYQDASGKSHDTHACYTWTGQYNSFKHVPERKEYT